MKPRGSWAVGLFLLGVLLVARPTLAADRTLSVDDVLRLHTAGVSEDIIISEIDVTGTVFDLQVEDILRLQQAGISDHLLQYMVDTGRESAADSAAADSADVRSGEDHEEAYVTHESYPRFFVTLNWGYPSWWYDSYWWDYWYYDCAYYPWYVSWSWPCHGWYPTWYSHHTCWAPAYWGYEHRFWRHHGWTRDGWWSWDRQGWSPNRLVTLSDHKYKLRDGSSGKLLYADAGLRNGDLTRFVRPGKLVVRSRPEDLALGGRKPAGLGGDIRRPVRSTVGDVPPDVRHAGVRHPAGPTGPGVATDHGDVRPTHPVRRPAPVHHQVRHVVRRAVPSPAQPPPDVRATDDGRGVRQRPEAQPAPPDSPQPRVHDEGDRRSAPQPRTSSPPPSHGGGDRGRSGEAPRGGKHGH